MKQSILFVCAAVLGITACSSEPEPEVIVPNPVAAVVKPEDPTAKMARAVGNGKPGAAVEIKYEIMTKPEVGQPTDVEIALIPGAGVETIDATISGMEGVTVSGQLTANYSQVEAGRAYKHTFSLLPERNGVYYLTVAVSTKMGGASLGRTFSIPLAVGNSPAQQKAEVKKDASGQAIEPMKAEEPGAR